MAMALPFLGGPPCAARATLSHLVAGPHRANGMSRGWRAADVAASIALGNLVSSSATTRFGRGERGPAFEVLESKLRPPRLSARSVLRTRLVDELNGGTAAPVVMLCAGPGYGK